MDDIEAIRKKKLRDLQQQQQPTLSQDEFEEAQQNEYEAQKKVILRAILMDDARERLGRIKAARLQKIWKTSSSCLLNLGVSKIK
jgi:programmed cell death protein 5